MARRECYTQLNVRGREEGHCGHSDMQFLPCNERYSIPRDVSISHIDTIYK